LTGQEIGYAQGIGLDIILLVNSKLKNKLGDVPKQLTVIEFDNDNFKQKCLLVALQVKKLTENFEKPIDVKAFLDEYLDR
jgi:hypothetical protein